MTLKTKFHGILLIALTIAITNSATIAEAAKKETTIKRTSPYKLELLGTYNYYSLVGDSTQADLNYEDKGTLLGARATLTYEGLYIPFFGRFTIDYAADKTKFEGYDRFKTFRSSYVQNDYERKEVNLGYTFTKIPDLPFDVTLYTGFGERKRGRSFDKGFSYYEEYQWEYFPVGIRADYVISRNLSGYVDFIGRFQNHSEADLELSNVDAACEDIDIEMEKEVGFRAETSISYIYKDNMSVTFAPWYEFTETDGSDPFTISCGTINETTQIIPTTTNQVGASLGVTIQF